MNPNIEKADNKLMHTYNRYPMILEKGEGVYLYDADGKKYLDFAAGIAVFALGYHNEAYNDAVKKQVDLLIHTSNLYYNQPALDAAEKLTKATGMDRVFFTNSGTEAIEGALKLARKYAYERDHHSDHEIIAMEHSFHGRSMGALSVTGQPKYREAFEPLIGGVVFAEFNDIESVKNKINEKTCAILLETVQGEGGIYPAEPEFLKEVSALCKQKDILLILDEIQCGMGRTGTMFAFEQYGIKPDIITSAKALGCGVPVGAFISTERVAQAFVPGDHGTTYGGNPLATAAVSKVFDLFDELHILDHVKEISTYLEQKLDELTEQYDVILSRRGMGLMQGLECSIPVGDLIKGAMAQGLILINAGTHILRFVPPLIITNKDVDDMISILKNVLDQIPS